MRPCLVLLCGVSLPWLAGCQYGLSPAGARVTIVSSAPPGCRRGAVSTTSIGSSDPEDLHNAARNLAAGDGDTIVLRNEHVSKPGEPARGTVSIDVYDCTRGNASASASARPAPPSPPRPASAVGAATPATPGAPPPPAIVPASDPCATPFVRLYTLPSTAPEAFDFPATRAALAGHPDLARMRFIEGSTGTARVFGAVAPDRAHADELVRVIAARVPSSAPVIACSVPTVLREIDLR